ncbi:hypothetical protein AHT39_001898 [Salmonella enterica subsp. enterica serovar Isangi]|uniref:hypothetical protein n=1 Tax=Salmonella enterica TaxID=28901 RepID=UPI001078D9A3|nr:hypothetical protein [Salmonella enterica]EBS0090859.1 hypothetical protein [Salmonella enterica subsp. enterica serovar Tennessee]EBW2699280.1 hypothetical protein [Salmonella enterica subsp. enterica serovar Galiema]EBX9355742.1 hypothetical protein [Salmonella enterica subsp. enterica serovar Mbandaka]ECC3197705.1 hypothetical protein [Salmonella enterica subsp. enterica]ECD4475405.1 hypothetical protein [Salmonella enterica subsp. enterica serovar Livingstone]EDA3558297.1 hypothetical 
MNKITNEQLDSLIKSAVNSSGPLPPDERFSQIISALRELRELRDAMLQGAEQQQNLQQNIQEIIPGGLVEAVNNLLNNDGSRGRYSAMECGVAREKIELWLAQRQKWEAQRSENLSAGNSPAFPDDWVMVPKEPTKEMVNAMIGVDGCSTSELLVALKLAIAAAPQQEAE